MQKQGKFNISLFLRLSGATIASIGFYLTALNRTITGASLIGIGGVLLAVGDSL